MTEQAITDEELSVIARFEVRRRSYHAPDGTALRRLPILPQGVKVKRTVA